MKFVGEQNTRKKKLEEGEVNENQVAALINNSISSNQLKWNNVFQTYSLE